MKSIIYFTQDLENCIHCKRMAPVVEALISAGFRVKKIEAFSPEGEHNPLNAKYDIRSTPTSIIVDDNGVEIDRIMGARPYSFMLEKLKD